MKERDAAMLAFRLGGWWCLAQIALLLPAASVALRGLFVGAAEPVWRDVLLIGGSYAVAALLLLIMARQLMARARILAERLLPETFDAPLASHPAEPAVSLAVGLWLLGSALPPLLRTIADMVTAGDQLGPNLREAWLDLLGHGAQGLIGLWLIVMPRLLARWRAR